MTKDRLATDRLATDRLPQGRLTESRKDIVATAAGRNGDRYVGGAKDRRPTAVAVAVMPLWDRPRAGACR